MMLFVTTIPESIPSQIEAYLACQIRLKTDHEPWIKKPKSKRHPRFMIQEKILTILRSQPGIGTKDIYYKLPNNVKLDSVRNALSRLQQNGKVRSEGTNVGKLFWNIFR